MPNPADDFESIEINRGPSQNRKGIQDIVDILKFFRTNFRYNAIIKSVDTANAGVYTVDIYEKFSDPPIYVDIEAVTVDSPMEYFVNTPCQVIRTEHSQAYIVRPTKFFFCKITDADYDFTNQSNFITGIPCASLGSTVLTEPINLDLSYSYPSNQLVNPATWIPDPDAIVLVMIYDIPILYSAANSIAETWSVGLIMNDNGSETPAGEFQWQGLMNVTANQTGFEWDRVHGLPNNA